MTTLEIPPESDDFAPSEGPQWAPHSLDVHGGRFPLSVEAHLMNMTASLVPGATTVTTSARYYTLHGAVALEGDRRQLTVVERLDLMRRCEVVMAAASIAHPAPDGGTVHGVDAIIKRSGGGTFDVEMLSTPKAGYSESQTGFLGPYLGSELTLGILADGTLAPGKRLNPTVLRAGFAGLFDLASQATVTADDLRAAETLSVGAVSNSEDGRWLARQLCAVGIQEAGRADGTRVGTVRLLARSATMAPSPSIVRSFRELVAYGPHLGSDPVVSSIPEAEPWRGTLFRHDSVGAWRQLWAWLTDCIDGPTRRDELVDKLAEGLPAMTLGEFERDLPPTTNIVGDPLDAESALRARQLAIPSEALGMVMLGAARAGELTGSSRTALVGNEHKVAVLSPLWVAAWVENRRMLPMHDVAADLTAVLLDRALRIAMGKMRMRDGRMWLPSVVAERGDYLYTVGREGRGNVGLRLEQLAGLLRSVGVLQQTPNHWALGTLGLDLLGAST